MAFEDYFESMTRDEFIAWFDGMDTVSHDAPLMVRASIRLPVDQVFHLDVLAEVDGTTRSDLVRAAVAAYLDSRAGETIPEPRAEAA